MPSSPISGWKPHASLTTRGSPNSSATCRLRDAQFRQWWAGTHVAVKRRGTRTYNHPVVGEITLDWDALSSDAEPDQQLVIYTAEPGSRSEQALRELEAWATEHNDTFR